MFSEKVNFEANSTIKQKLRDWRGTRGRRKQNSTWNVLSTTIAVGQLAHVFTALCGGLIGCWLGIQRFGSRWRVTVDVDELLSMLHDRFGWFQRWAGGTSVNQEKSCFALISISGCQSIKMFHTVGEFHGQRLVKRSSAYR